MKPEELKTWNNYEVKRVLQDIHCTGDSVFGKYQKSVFLGNKQRNRPERGCSHLYAVIPVTIDFFPIYSIQVNPRTYKSEVITYCLIKKTIVKIYDCFLRIYAYNVIIKIGKGLITMRETRILEFKETITNTFLNHLILLPKMLYREKRESLFIAGTGFMIPDADLWMKVKNILCWHLILKALIRESMKCS